jgi:iron(III) transport system ATP-binding protein
MDKSKSFAIEIDGVSRLFRGVRALDRVSLSVFQGEIVSLIGQSGCGKSTLLRIISGVDPEHDGSVTLFGDIAATANVFVEPEKRNVGFMLQDYALFPHLTVEQNIWFGVKKIAKPVAQARVDRIVGRLSLGALVKKYPHMLSGGEQQRVALARALAPEPAILLMDEPFSNLDRRLADSIRMETLAILRELKTTVIMVTHDPEEALSSSDRIALMRNGSILQIGTPYELYFHPKSRYTADYFCAYNKFPGTFHDGKLHTEFGNFPASFDAANGSAVIVYVRPQAVSVSRAGEGLAGRILSRTFKGEAEQLMIALDGLKQPVMALIPNLLPDGDERVQVVIPSIGVLAFLS